MTMTFIRRRPRAIMAGLAGAAAVAVGASLFASDDVIKFSEIAEFNEEVVVPIPSEVFNVLDKLEVTRNHWRDELNVPEEKDCRDRTHFALFLGRVVAEGFLAVEAQDQDAIRSLGRTVLAVAEELGLRHAVLPHSKSIIDEANRGDWKAVRAEFDATRQTVRDEMERRRDQDLAHCVSVGGWLRGTEIVTAIIAKDYSSKRAEILHQPQLIEHFTKTFKGNDRFVRNKRMKEVIAHLEKLEPLMGSEDAISLESVKRIHQLCHTVGAETIAP